MSDPIVDPSDLASYFGLASVDEDRATLLLQLAQDLCESIVPAPLPEGSAAVIFDVVGRVWGNPLNVTQQAGGSYSVSYAASTPSGLTLTRANTSTLRRLAGGGGAFSVDLVPADALTTLPIWDVDVEVITTA